MRIQIAEHNKTAIEERLLAVNGKATSFTVTAFSDVQDVVEEAEALLGVLPKAQRLGATCSYQPAGPTAKSYRFSAKSTRLHLVRESAGWYLLGVTEALVYPRSGRKLIVEISAEQASEIQRRVVIGFVVREPVTPRLAA
ncbi:hypothetical protein [Dongia sp.]|uniref:hypothetical protein n=1 Tax=Dongia sp. TaxID=1977262 RepID=UPI0035AFD13D